MAYEIPQSKYPPTPSGQHDGVIIAVNDEGTRESTFDGATREVHKLSVDIESDTAFMDDGRPYVHREWCTLSGHDRSKLVKLRQGLLGRPLSKEEKLHFDEDTEMVGRRVQYLIEHEFVDGKVYPRLTSWSLLEDAVPLTQSVADSTDGNEATPAF